MRAWDFFGGYFRGFGGEFGVFCWGLSEFGVFWEVLQIF